MAKTVNIKKVQIIRRMHPGQLTYAETHGLLLNRRDHHIWEHHFHNLLSIILIITSDLRAVIHLLIDTLELQADLAAQDSHRWIERFYQHKQTMIVTIRTEFKVKEIEQHLFLKLKLIRLFGTGARQDFHSKPSNPSGNGSVMTGVKASPRSSVQVSSAQPVYSSPNQPFEDVLLRQRTLGQDIIPSPREPKRTESLYTPQKPMPTGGSAAVPSGGGGFFKSGKLKVRIIIVSFLWWFIFALYLIYFFP